MYKSVNFWSASFVLMTVMLLGACSSDDNPNSEVTICEEGKAYNEASVLESLSMAITDLIGEYEVTCFDEVTISVQYEENANFYVIEYGELNDCPSGCFSSVACIINDENGSELYSAIWTSAEEMPIVLEGNCESDSIGGEGSSQQNCQEPPSGYLHPITYTNEFQDLIYSDETLFRRCR